MALLKAGDHVVCSRDVFGTTTNLFAKYMAKFGVSVSFVPLLDLEPGSRRLPRKPPCCFWRHRVTPCARSPISRHSRHWPVPGIACWWWTTASVRRRCRHRSPGRGHRDSFRHQVPGRPGPLCWRGRGGSAEHMTEVVTFLRTCGPTMSAFNAWVFLKGLETLRLRMDAHSAAATGTGQLAGAAADGGEGLLCRAGKIIPGMHWPGDSNGHLAACCLFRSRAGKRGLAGDRCDSHHVAHGQPG